MTQDTSEFHIPAGPWTPVDRDVPGMWEQELTSSSRDDFYTGLIRYEAGVDTSPIGARVHDYWEHVYIISGEITDLGLNQTFIAGMYASRPPGQVHGPWRSETGVLMLEIRFPAKAP